MNSQNEIFENRVKDCIVQLEKTDFLNRTYLPGIAACGHELVVPLFGESFCITAQGVNDSSGHKTNPAISVLLMTYILNYPSTLPEEGNWITYREFRDAGPLTGYFTENTNKIIETTFSGKINALADVCRRIGGKFQENDTGYDLSVKFEALPGVLLLLRFNEADGPFPAQCGILFRESAEVFFDVKTLGIVGTFLVGRLLRTTCSV